MDKLWLRGGRGEEGEGKREKEKPERERGIEREKYKEQMMVRKERRENKREGDMWRED